jgi:aspartate ammonia-lyase
MKLSKQHKQYQSEITQFINELKQKNPNLEASQRAGRALLWDKAPIDLDQVERSGESRVKQQPYVYQTKL